MTPLGNQKKIQKPAWIEDLRNYQVPDLGRSLWQVVCTLLLFVAIWYIMYRSLEISYLLTLLLAVLNAGFVVRIFIIQHDCGHRSFFKSSQACNVLGSVLGVITLTPYFHWRHQHDKHHATYADLDNRGNGDISTMTMEEFMASSKEKRLGYRILRHPLVLFGIGPALSFIFWHRIPYKTKMEERREWWSVILTDLALIAIIVGMGQWIGYKAFLMVQLPITIIASSLGVWLFYVQHQFENVYWRRHADWDYTSAAIHGASYYRLPALLQWFSGNIGFHHVHHLRPRIPNYKLQKAHAENAIFHDATSLTISQSLKSINLRLWDEVNRKLVGFDALPLIVKKSM